MTTCVNKMLEEDVVKLRGDSVDKMKDAQVESVFLSGALTMREKHSVIWHDGYYQAYRHFKQM